MHLWPLHGESPCLEWRSTVRQNSTGAESASIGFGDLVHLARLPPVTIPLVAIVDDDEPLCSALVDLMRSVGYRAEPFISAETFLISDIRFNLDCMVADIHMPGIGGFALIDELHEQGIATPVILITGLPDQHLDEEAISRGALCLLRKPFETRSLLDWIERSLLQ
jgi:FixJ family two-component response regulator